MTTPERVRAIIGEQLGHPNEDVAPGCRLAEDLQADSLDGVELILGLQEAFDITISDEEADDVTTVQDLIDLVEAKTHAGGTSCH